jgi:ABC-type glycerol-3-phosphate transport system substrate-binding protein
VIVAELYSRRSFLAGVLTAGMLSTSAGFLLTRRESIKLRLATGVDKTGGRELLITMWNQLNPDTQIVPQVVNSSTQDQFAKFNQTQADIFNLDAIHIRRFADAGKIIPFDPQNDISLLQPVRRVCEKPGTGQLWAAPFNTDVGMLFRRIADKGTADAEPSLSTVLRESATGPNRLAGQLDTVGIQTDEAFVCNVLEHALAADDAILDEGGVLSYGLGQWRNALAPLAEAVRGKRVRALAGEDDTTRAFSRESLRYMRNWPVEFPALDRAERVRPDTAEIRLGRLPVGVLGGQSLAISADTEHRAEAERAIHFLTDTPAQKLLATFGFAPTGVDAYIDAAIQATLPHLNIIRYAVESARPRPMHANYAEFSRRFADHTRRYLHGGEPLTQRFIQDIQEALR